MGDEVRVGDFAETQRSALAGILSYGVTPPMPTAPRIRCAALRALVASARYALSRRDTVRRSSIHQSPEPETG